MMNDIILKIFVNTACICMSMLMVLLVICCVAMVIDNFKK